MEPPGLAPGCQRRYLLGPLEEEEKGIGIASDVVKVEGEDPATRDKTFILTGSVWRTP